MKKTQKVNRILSLLMVIIMVLGIISIAVNAEDITLGDAPPTFSGMGILGDGSDGSSFQISYKDGKFSGTLPYHNSTADKNTTDFRLTINGLAEGESADLIVGEARYPFVGNTVTTGDDHIVSDVGDYVFQIKVMSTEGEPSVYTLNIKKPELKFKTTSGAMFFKGNPLFSSIINIKGQPEGTVFQLDSEGNITGKTGIDPECYEYQIYVNPKVMSVSLNKTLDLYKMFPTATSRIQIYGSGKAMLENPANIPTSMACAVKANSISVPLDDGITDLVYALFDKSEPDNTKNYTFHFQRLAANSMPRIKTADISGGVFSSASGFNSDNSIQGIQYVKGTEKVIITMTTDEDVVLYQESMLEENRLTPNDQGTYVVDTPTASTYKIIADKNNVNVLYEFKFFSEDLSAGTTNPGNAGSVDIVERIINYCPAPATSFVSDKTVESGAFDFIYEGITSWKRFASLGGFGGYMTFAFDQHPIVNDSKNPYGIDFIVYGNNFGYGAPEPASVQVSQDGIKWYTLAGSMHYETTTNWNASATLVNGKEITAVQLAKDSFPSQPLFGYGEVHACSGTKDAEENYNVTGVAGNPYNADHVKNIGDGFDLSWAVDKDGKPVQLDEILYIRTQNAVDISNPAFGTNSPEIGTLTRSVASLSSVGKTTEPTSLMINGVEYATAVPKETINDGQTKYFEIDLADNKQAAARVKVTCAKDDNISINNQLFSGSADYIGLLKFDGSRMIRVIVQNGEKEPLIYVFNITGGGNPDINADLNNISIIPGDVTIKSVDVQDATYTFTVDNSVEKVSLKIDSLNPKAAIRFNNENISSGIATQAFAVNVGENNYSIHVTATNGQDSKDYTVKIVRKDKIDSPIEGDTIKVDFKLIGDTKHGEGGMHSPETWLNKRGVEIPKDSTVKYVTDMLFLNNDMDYDNTDGTYISKIKSPGGYWLAEFDNGPNSGWMYRHNSKIANVGYADRVLQNGDKIEWFYTDDYTKETGYEGDWDKVNSNPVTDTDTKPINKSLDNGTVKIKSDELKNATSINITGDVNMTIDTASLRNIGTTSDISITVKKVNGDKLDKASKGLIGNRPVYEITITSGGKEVTKLSDGKITISIPYTPAQGENIVKLFGYYVDSNGKAEKMSGSKYDSNKKAIVIVTNHLSEYAVGYDENAVVDSNFSDVATSHWANEYISYLSDKGIIKGRTDTIFAPSDNITRAEFAAILSRMSGESVTSTESKFIDVNTKAWYAQNVAWAVNTGLTKGVTDNTFAPNDKITRQEMAVTIVRYAEYKKYDLPKTKEQITFADQVKISDYAKKAVSLMQQAGIINGQGDNIFVPKGEATRAETAKMLTILMQGMGK